MDRLERTIACQDETGRHYTVHVLREQGSWPGSWIGIGSGPQMPDGLRTFVLAEDPRRDISPTESGGDLVMDALTMDTQLDLTAHETAEREAARQRSLETLERTTALLAELRDPELVRRAAEAQREYQQRRAEERTAEAEKMARQLPPPAARKAAPAPAPKPVAYVTKAAFRQYQDGIEAAVAKFVRETVTAALARMTWRTTEAERRLADIEDRLAKLEGQADG